MTQSISILVVEDEDDQRLLVCSILSRAGYQVHQADTVNSAEQTLLHYPIDLVFSDWKLKQQSGLDLLAHVLQEYPDTAFILATGHGSITHAVDSIRAGADDYLVKPYQKETLLFAVQRVSKARQLIAQNKTLEKAISEREKLVDLVGRAPCMQKLYTKIERLADTRATVLITGESGTGKELAARALQQLSERKNAAFVAVNCSAIPETLAEAEFFGAEKGSYTGAIKQKIGKFEFAHNGTLFLDEIGELPLSLQPKLLRLLQEGRFTRIGGNQEIEVDVRLVAATNRNLEEEVKQGRFREDLFYRLNVVPIVMPPLRYRKEDIPALVKHFSDVARRRHQLDEVTFSAAILKQLLQYSWPGNVRELGNIVERMVLMAESGVASSDELPISHGSDSNTTFNLPASGINWEQHERSCIEQAMIFASGNRTQAAKLLGLSYKAFVYRLDKLASH
jgi:DNA-binding NtrC family response regulator